MIRSKFVIVKHDAIRARLHYDLRFVMPKSKLWASFAVRKGVPTQPGQKVLAVRTHDHTEQEALFFGTIRQGYGAGRLTKWDSGDCTIYTYTPGKIAIEFKGSKVKGLYYMISTGVINKKDFKKQSYMLFKSKKSAKDWTKSIVEQNISEKEWNEPDSYRDYLKPDRFIKQNRDLSYSSSYNDETQSQQPTYAGIHMKMGGDYMGRHDTANMYRDLHGGYARSNPREKEHEFRKSLLRPGKESKLKSGEAYNDAQLMKDRAEKEYPKKSEFPKLELVEMAYNHLEEIMGMISLVPRDGIVDDVELSCDELESPDLPWDKTPKKVTGPAGKLKLKPSKYNMGGG